MKCLLSVKTLLIALAALTTACVPAAEEPDPAGAAGVIAEPSAATRGEPFTSSDGYRITIERLFLFVNMTAGPDDVVFGDGGLFLWNGAERQELLIRALRLGPKVVKTTLFAPPRFETEKKEGAERTVPIQSNFSESHGVPPDVQARFEAPASGWEEESGRRPALIVVGRAEKDGLGIGIVTFDLAMVAFAGEPVSQKVDVVANAPAVARLEVAVEKLFASFQDVADADRAGDGDGHVTGIELRNATCATCEEQTLLEHLSRQTSAILVAK